MKLAVIAAFALLLEAPAAPTKVLPIALLPFQEKGEDVKGVAAKVDALLFASFAAEPSLYLVDRADLSKALDEHQLSLSGMVTPETSVQVGQLTGAKILVTGSVFDVDGATYVVAKMIGTETSIVLGESVKGKKEGLSALVESLASKIVRKLDAQGGEIVAPERALVDRIASLREALGTAARPSVSVEVRERHVGATSVDPAAHTELERLLKETGFSVLERDADVAIEGEATSELLARRGELVSVRARVEVRAVEKSSGRVLAVDRQTVLVVDLGDVLAGKAAIQEAAARLASRMLPKLVLVKRKA
jgi:curli production assembly/transport component CsgG